MMRKRKLAYIIHGIALGGAEVALLSALPRLHEQYELRVHVLGSAKSHLLDKIDPDIRKRIHLYQLPVFLFPVYLPFLLLSILRFHPDVLISSLWRSAIPATIYKTLCSQTKYFILIHSSNFFHPADRYFTSMGIRKADTIFTDSNASKSFIKDILEGNEKPVKALSFLMDYTYGETKDRDYTNAVKFYFVGRLNEVKRVPLAVTAIAWLRKEGIDASLDIYGAPDNDEKNVKAEIINRGLQEAVRLRGVIDPERKFEVLSNYNFYIQLSKQEGMAMSVAEAMQYGALCFVTPVGEIGTYAKDGYSAIFADPTNEVTWEQSLMKLKKVITDVQECREISRRAHQTFIDVPVFADSLIEAIEHYA